MNCCAKSEYNDMLRYNRTEEISPRQGIFRLFIFVYGVDNFWLLKNLSVSFYNFLICRNDLLASGEFFLNTKVSGSSLLYRIRGNSDLIFFYLIITKKKWIKRYFHFTKREKTENKFCLPFIPSLGLKGSPDRQIHSSWPRFQHHGALYLPMNLQ